MPSALRNPRSALAVAAGLFVGLVTLTAIGAVSGGSGERAALDRQWALRMVRAEGAWATTRGAGVTVAVVDTGVDGRHPALADRVAGGADCVGAGGDPGRCRPGGDTDLDGHGTHVAGLVVASGGDVRGVAPEADLLAVRAFLPGACARRPCGATGDGRDLSAGLRWAVAAGADVVNLSVGFGAGGIEDDLLAAIEEAWEAGVVVVVAGPTAREAAALAETPALVVTALDAEARPAPYATGTAGARWALAAPGGAARAASDDGCRGTDAVLSTVVVPGGEREAYGCLVGTSMAAPHVAGAAALLRARGLDAPATVERLLATAEDLGPPGPDEVYGAGLLDVTAAVTDP